MTDKTKTVPDLRFAGYTNAWEQRKLSELYQDIGNAFVGTATPYYVDSGHFYLESNNIKDGQINRNSEIFINDEFYEKQQDKWLKTGDMVMVQSGHVGHAAVIPEELNNSAAHALIMFRKPKAKIEPYFLNYQYQTYKFKKKIDNITTGNTIKHILASDMQEFTVDITSYEEQSKIADLFRGIDDAITLHQRKYDGLQLLKKSMLQKLFPKDGETKPEIRFAGFTDAWEQRKFDEITIPAGVRNKDNLPLEPYSITNDRGFLPQNEAHDDFGYMQNTDRKAYIVVSPYSFGYNPARINVGSIGYYQGNENVIVSSLYEVFKTQDYIDDHFLMHWFKSDLFPRWIEKFQEGSVRQYFYYDKLCECSLTFPSIEEQKKIAALIDSLDTTINLHQRKLEQLKTIKQFLLQKMFV